MPDDLGGGYGPKRDLRSRTPELAAQEKPRRVRLWRSNGGSARFVVARQHRATTDVTGLHR